MRSRQNSILYFFLLCSVVTVFINDILLNEIPEIISFGDELGAVLSNLSLAYISSWIFYYVVVVIKENSDKRNIDLIVYDLTNNLIGRAYSIYDILLEASGARLDAYDRKTITKEQFRELCEKVNPNAIRPGRSLGSLYDAKPATFGQFIHSDAISYVRHYSDKIFNYMPFLETEYVRLLNQIVNSNFCLYSDFLAIPTRNKDLTSYCDNMFEYLEFVRKMELYNEGINGLNRRL